MSLGLGEGVPTPRAGILVDEEFGAGILRDAIAHGYVTALSTEKSGSDEFEFEYGTRFAEHIESFGPTFAKVLVRYNPDRDADLNQRQTARLTQLSDYCKAADQQFMFELLVPATKAQMERVQGDKQTYDLRIRPELMLQTIRALPPSPASPRLSVTHFLPPSRPLALCSSAQRGERERVPSGHDYVPSRRRWCVARLCCRLLGWQGC